MTEGTLPSVVGDKLWANSGDSHAIEPLDLFDSLPDGIKELMPRSVKDPSGEFETIYVDGQEFTRPMPRPAPDGKPRQIAITARPTDSGENEFIDRALGGNDPVKRIQDLDDEGIWCEVIYPSLGTCAFN